LRSRRNGGRRAKRPIGCARRSPAKTCEAVVIIALAGLAVAAAGLLVFTAVAARLIEARFPPVGDRIATGPGGAAVHVVERSARAPERGAVLVVHGASGNFADMDAALGERLSALGFRVFAVDRPGHGWSDRLAGADPTSPAGQAAALRAALAQRGVERAIVVVHSLGGMLGLAMALDAPQFARGLVLLAPVSHPWPGGVAWYYRLAASPLFGPAFRRLFVLPAGLVSLRGGVREVFAPDPPPRDYVFATRLPLVLRPRHFRANAEDVVAAAAHVAALSPRYPTIRIPTAIVTGDHDGVVYAKIHSAGCARDIPGATLTVLPGVGHSPHHSAPDRAVAAILEVEARALSEEGRQLDRAPAPV
jgi:pimeloyl-ACP methyl ester carboxylesterase